MGYMTDRWSSERSLPARIPIGSRHRRRSLAPPALLVDETSFFDTEIANQRENPQFEPQDYELGTRRSYQRAPESLLPVPRPPGGADFVRLTGKVTDSFGRGPLQRGFVSGRQLVTTVVVLVRGIAPGTALIRASAPPFIPEITASVTVLP
jgi:hypothetical protein